MTLPPDLNIYVSAIMFFLGAYIFALYLGMIVWTVRDIRSRTRDVLAQILATVLVAVFTLPGLMIYFLLRPHTTLAEEYERSLTEEAILQELEERRVCPGCRHRVESDFVICPHCHHQLRLRCVGCGRLLNPTWDVCPYCGRFHDEEAAPEGPTDVQEQPVEERDPVEQAAAAQVVATSAVVAPAPADVPAADHVALAPDTLNDELDDEELAMTPVPDGGGDDIDQRVSELWSRASLLEAEHESDDAQVLLDDDSGDGASGDEASDDEEGWSASDWRPTKPLRSPESDAQPQEE